MTGADYIGYLPDISVFKHALVEQISRPGNLVPTMYEN